MSERIRKYTGEDEAESGGNQLPADRMKRVRDKLMQMPPEQREKIMQQMRERRNLKRGGARFSGPDGGPDSGPEGFPGGGPGGFPGGPPGGGPEGMMPDGPPPGGGPRGFRGEGGPPEMGGPGGFRRGGNVRNFGGAGGGQLKGGKFFGREPLDLTVLNLTAEQKAKIQTMRSANGQKARALHSDIKARRDKFRDMLFDPSASNDQILGARREINKLQTQAEDLMLNDFLGIRKLLTKEQMDLLPQVRPEEPVRRPYARPAKKRKGGGDSELSGRGGDS
jgi:Spy/CpxP family protein refolding chaperone